MLFKPYIKRMNEKISIIKEKYRELVKKAKKFDSAQKVFAVENLKEYANPEKIKSSYKKAAKTYKPISPWK